MLTPDGEYIGIYSGDMPIALYTDHIHLTFYEGENEPYVMDIENPLYGSSTCGAYWNAYLLASGNEQPIEMVVHNPHRFGNEMAIDEMLSNLSLWGNIDFEKDILESGKTQRNAGLLFIIVSLVGFSIHLIISIRFSLRIFSITSYSEQSNHLVVGCDDSFCWSLSGIQCIWCTFLE